MSVVSANNNALSAITALPASISGGELNLISTQTASGSANLSFTSGIDSTYKEYVFKFINIHPATDNTTFTFNLSVDGGSNYNVAKTTTVIRAFHDEGDSSTELDYLDGLDLANGTGVQALVENIGNGNDESSSGTLHLFEPSSTTFVKHYISRIEVTESAYSKDNYSSGYFNTTSAINAVQFKFASGNIDSGTISLYGIN